MLKLFSWSKNNVRADVADARQIYRKTMAQSRQAMFFKPGYVTDSYDGRMEVLCMHLSVLLHALKEHGENGKKLSQAVYDVMIDDFDIALREEALSDTSVARRIKPLAEMFFHRAKTYEGALNNPKVLTKFIATYIDAEDSAHTKNTAKMVEYTQKYADELMGKTLGQIAKGDFSYPEFI